MGAKDQVLDGLLMSNIMTGVAVERRAGQHMLNSSVIRAKGLPGQ